jgi:hypothetical protein
MNKLFAGRACRQYNMALRVDGIAIGFERNSRRHGLNAGRADAFAALPSVLA